MAKRRLVIEGASIVTLDPRLGDIREGDILIEDDAILAVGADLGVTDAGNVGTVVVGGNVVKREGAMVGVDPAGVRRQVEESQAYVRGWADEHGGILPRPRIALGF
jgi:hypothetical protein